MEATLRVLNELERNGVISRYAIGGAVGAIFYMEPFLTYDLDISAPWSAFRKWPRPSCGNAALPSAAGNWSHRAMPEIQPWGEKPVLSGEHGGSTGR